MYKISKMPLAVDIGYVGETGFRKLEIDMKDWMRLMPEGVPSIVCIRPGETKADAYVAVTTFENDVLTWVITATDIGTQEGEGEIQIWLEEEENSSVIKRGKSVKVKTRVNDAVNDPSPDTPTSQEAFIEQVTELKTAAVNAKTAAETAQEKAEDAQEAAEQAAEDAEAAVVHQPYIDSTSKHWMVWDNETEAYVDTEILAEGHTPVRGTDYWTQQDQTAVVAAAAQATAGEIIDDTAGEGATGKTWSANKLDETTGLLLNEIESMTTATASDVGKALSPKTVNNGKVTEWKFVSVGGGGSVETDKTMTEEDVPADAKAVGDIVNDLTDLVPSKNLYDKNACNPQNGKQYNTYGVEADNDKYAITGKIPVEAGVQYIFSIGGLGKVKSAYYYGSDGNSLVGKETLDNAAFTTPTGTAFVGLTLFAATHTAEAYNSAIAVAQLEKGSVATNFVPYSLTRKVPSDRLVDGEAVEGAVNFTTKASLINLYDKTIAIDGKYINSQTHALTDNSSYSFSGLIPVKPNTQYCYSKDKSVSVGSLSSTVQEWDENGSFIRSGSFGTASTHINQVRTGATTKYISFNITYSESHTTQQFNDLIDTLMVCEGCQRPLEYSAYNEEPVVNHLKLDNMYQNNADRFRGKRWLVTGTSVSYQDSKEYTEGVADGELVRGYIGDIARRKPMLITNNAVSGSTLAGSDANSLINTYQNYTYTDFDFMTIEYGINDFGNNVLVGTASDAPGTGTFAACLKTVIEYVLTQNPIIGLIICTDPCVRDSTNNNGNTLKEYMDVMLEIAKQYRLPVCDWFYQSGINSITKGDGSSRNFLTQHGTHPSVYGHMRMGAMLNQVFDSLLC